MKLNENMIAALEEKGFSRWTKNGMDRLYINAETALGLEVSTNRSGHVSGAYLNGERISNSRGTELKDSKTYIDIETGELVSNNSTMEAAAQEIIDAVTAEMEQATVESTEQGETEAVNPYHELSDDALILAEGDQKAILTRINADGYMTRENVTVEDREKALEALHEIRLEKWARGWNGTPTESERDTYERHLSKSRDRLEAARATGEDHKIYAAQNRVNEYIDRLAYIEQA